MDEWLVRFRRTFRSEEVLVIKPTTEKLLRWIQQNGHNCVEVHIQKVESTGAGATVS